ncbi:uncharacterized protein A1O5_09732 [Cladophialophora psammophila CBS 110553]|uniref:Uncharacterized protein n=1 Tax=Cladophialophora psammophila CBS 110553 TaxID=1182543 RepID=W9WQY9_9EURO|nr:uncharacterized protein A1O5_09732 [Cladophialophora psammophila CBS 110553]EXJ67086.1 hypothetical protein A1O5_09732 [Cladophialophora psammophila CBS 110553]
MPPKRSGKGTNESTRPKKLSNKKREAEINQALFDVASTSLEANFHDPLKWRATDCRDLLATVERRMSSEEHLNGLWDELLPVMEKVADVFDRGGDHPEDSRPWKLAEMVGSRWVKLMWTWQKACSLGENYEAKRQDRRAAADVQRRFLMALTRLFDRHHESAGLETPRLFLCDQAGGIRCKKQANRGEDVENEDDTTETASACSSRAEEGDLEAVEMKAQEKMASEPQLDGFVSVVASEDNSQSTGEGWDVQGQAAEGLGEGAEEQEDDEDEDEGDDENWPRILASRPKQ